MSKLLILAVIVIGLPSIAFAEPERMKDGAVLPPCDSSSSTDKPPCNMDSENVTVPPVMPNEDKSVIVPPDIPAEGLPNKPKPDAVEPALPDKG